MAYSVKFHRKLDEALLDACGWLQDLSGEEISERLLVSSDDTLADLYVIIQAAMGCWDYHLHQ